MRFSCFQFSTKKKGIASVSKFGDEMKWYEHLVVEIITYPTTPLTGELFFFAFKNWTFSASYPVSKSSTYRILNIFNLESFKRTQDSYLSQL